MRILILTSLAVVACVFSTTLVFAQTHDTHQHSFQGADQWVKEFDNPQRDEWQKPHQVIQTLALKPDKIVADIGSGTGYFTVRFAHMLPQGRVYGVDIEPEMVKYLAERAKRMGLKNVFSIQALPDDPRLPEKVDLIFIVDTYHHIDNRGHYFKKLHDLLNQDGRIAIIDFRMDSVDGPPKSARSTPQQIKAELSASGYELAQEYDFLPKQYFIVFKQAKK
jgi:cyclopropane fatty-acyl-phospholipid synthase-like methyltransferase